MCNTILIKGIDLLYFSISAKVIYKYETLQDDIEFNTFTINNDINNHINTFVSTLYIHKNININHFFTKYDT